SGVWCRERYIVNIPTTSGRITSQRDGIEVATRGIDGASAMRSSPGSTTVTEASSLRQSVGPTELVLVWLFPRPGEPPVPLNWPGDDEVLIGRDAACGVRLEGNDVSRRHAALRRSAPGAGVVILGLGRRD